MNVFYSTCELEDIVFFVKVYRNCVSFSTVYAVAFFETSVSKEVFITAQY